MADDSEVTNVTLVNQALHGYRDGHRLLGASLELSAGDRRVLARQTDNPDSGRAGNWMVLLSGFPLPSGLFALSLTWPAPEMPRPGCVWTHSLLFDEAGIANIEPDELLSLFRRPHGTLPDLEPYLKGLDAVASQSGGHQPQFEEIAWAETISWAMYEPPVRAVRVLRVDLADTLRHELMLRTWIQAWPELRATLTFADAPRTTRDLDQREFDLLFQQGEIRTEAGKQTRIVRGIPDVAPPAWVGTLVSESYRPDGLMQFTAEYAPSTSNPGKSPNRGTNGVLAELFTEHESASPPDLVAARIVSILGTRFPLAGEALLLKVALLNPSNPPIGCSHQLDEVSLLQALVLIGSSEAFPPEELNIRRRTELQMHVRSQAMISIVESIGDTEGRFADEFLDGVVSALDPASLEESNTTTKTVLLLANRSVELLRHSATWRLAPSRELISLMRTLGAPEQREEMLLAALTSGAELDPEDVVSAWTDADELIIDVLLRANIGDTEARRWLRTVDPALLIRRVMSPRRALPKGLLALALEEFPPDFAAQVPPDTLLELLKGPNTKVSVAAKALAGASRRTSVSQWADIAAIAFDRLADPIRHDELGPLKALFDGIGGALPRWDVLGRISAFLNGALRGPKWSSLATLGIKNRRAFASIIDADTDAGLARRVLIAAAEKGISIEPWQHEVLNRAMAQRADRDSLAKTLETVGKFIFRTLRL
jgi:hypothetical protein